MREFFLSIILGVYISLNYAEIHAYVSIKGVILNASRYLLLVIGMTVLYAFITMRIIKKRREGYICTIEFIQFNDFKIFRNEKRWLF